MHLALCKIYSGDIVLFFHLGPMIGLRLAPILDWCLWASAVWRKWVRLAATVALGGPPPSSGLCVLGGWSLLLLRLGILPLGMAVWRLRCP